MAAKKIKTQTIWLFLNFLTKNKKKRVHKSVLDQIGAKTNEWTEFPGPKKT